MFERVKHIIIKEIIQTFRDPRMKAVVFVMPIMQLLIIGYAVNNDVKNIATAIYDQDNTPESREFVRQFILSKYFMAREYISTEKEQQDAIDHSRVKAVIRIDRGFGGKLVGNKNAQVQLIIDGTDSNTAAVILSYASAIIEKYSSVLRRDQLQRLLAPAQAFPKVELTTRTWFNENLISRNFFVPGVLVLMVSLISLLLTAMAIVREKEIGTMEQIIVTPIKPFEFILGKIIPFAGISLIVMSIAVSVAVFWFRIPLRGSVILLFFSALLYILTTLGIGLFISTISKTQQEAMLSGFMFFFPAMLLSGFVFPIANMPKIIQYITYINPLRYFLVVIRGIFLKGIGIEVLWPQLLVLFIMGISVFTLSSLRFKKRLG
jgi:ABC-2 type transport system permease protein